MSCFTLWDKFAKRGDHTSTLLILCLTHSLHLKYRNTIIDSVSVLFCASALILCKFFCFPRLHFSPSSLKHFLCIFPTVYSSCIPSFSHPLHLIAPSAKVDWFSANLSVSAVCCLLVVPIFPSVCPPASLHLALSAFRLHLPPFSIFIQLFVRLQREWLSLSKLQSTFIYPPITSYPSHTRTCAYTNTRSSSPSDDVDHHPAIWINRQTVAAMTCKNWPEPK